MGNHALVFGASGISGWAVTNLLLEGYPSPNTFESVTALTNRPLTAQEALWPESPKLQLCTGIEILAKDFEEVLKSKATQLAKVTHVYFFAFMMDPDPAKEAVVNRSLLSKAVRAVEKLSPNLQFVVLPTGSKAYGVHLMDKFPFADRLPLRETLPRIPEPYASQLFYYHQLDELAELSQGKSWSWCTVMPDQIIGFVPNNNVYCLAQTLAIYLSLYVELHGKGSEVAFPGTQVTWQSLNSDSFQDNIARIAIFASLHPEQSSGQGYNVVDTVKPSSWSRTWPAICEYFGLKGVPPAAPSGDTGPGVPPPPHLHEPTQYLSDRLTEWKELERKHGLVTGRVGNDRSFALLAYFLMAVMGFDRQMDGSKSREMMKEREATGELEVDAKTAWWTTFDRFRRARIIP